MKGILFKPDMHQAVIEGRKTQTRRINTLKGVNENPDKAELYEWWQKDDQNWDLLSLLGGWYALFKINNGEYWEESFRPRYQPGDIIYAKEPYFTTKGIVTYRYFNDTANIYPDRYWKNKLFMPAKYARHFIMIVKVGVERLQDITLGSALYEGVNPYEPLAAFQGKWIQINGKKSWNENPWVWIYEFIYLKNVHNLKAVEDFKNHMRWKLADNLSKNLEGHETGGSA